MLLLSATEASIALNLELYHQGFGERCTPRGQCTFGPRLQEDEIKLLAEFVKAQADRGWPKIESYGDWALQKTKVQKWHMVSRQDDRRVGSKWFRFINDPRFDGDDDISIRMSEPNILIKWRDKLRRYISCNISSFIFYSKKIILMWRLERK